MANMRSPDTAALLKITDFHVAETARYAAERYDEVIIKLKLQDKPAAIKMGKSLQHIAELLESEEPSMNAAMRASIDALKRPNQIRQDTLALDAQKTLGDIKSKPIDMIYGISDQSEILRIYSIDGDHVDSSVDEKIDAVFNGWLVSNDLLIKDGVIYESDEEGEPKLNTNGTLKRADPDVLRELFEDPDQGLSSSLKRKGLSIETQVYPYPESRAEVDKQIQEATAVKQDLSQQENAPPMEKSETGMGRQG